MPKKIRFDSDTLEGRLAQTIGPVCDKRCPAFLGDQCGIPIKDKDETFWIKVKRGDKCHIALLARELGIVIED